MNAPRHPPGLHWPTLLTGIALMAIGAVYPLVFAGPDGHADHGLALLLFWAMSTGFVRGVGFVPRQRLWRWLFSEWSCLATLGLAALSVALRS